MNGIRRPLAAALRMVAAAKPKTVAIDLTLEDPSEDSRVDDELAAAMRATPNLVLGDELLKTGWAEPLPEFREAAVDVGHVYAATGGEVTRAIPLQEHRGHGQHAQRWALSLTTFLRFQGAPLIQSPEDLRVGGTVIPAPDDGKTESRYMRVRFSPPGKRPESVSMGALLRDPSLASAFTGKAVFIGVTALTLRDSLITPADPRGVESGVEIHTDAFETMRSGEFLTDIGLVWVVLFSIALAAGAGLSFRYLPGWMAYAGGGAVILAAVFAPYVFFTHGRVFSFQTPAAVAWLSVGTAAAYYHLVVRRDWRKEQAARERYQQAMHFVTHEMRTPLSAIQRFRANSSPAIR